MRSIARRKSPGSDSPAVRVADAAAAGGRCRCDRRPSALACARARSGTSWPPSAPPTRRKPTQAVVRQDRRRRDAEVECVDASPTLGPVSRRRAVSVPPRWAALAGRTATTSLPSCRCHSLGRSPIRITCRRCSCAGRSAASVPSNSLLTQMPSPRRRGRAGRPRPGSSSATVPRVWIDARDGSVEVVRNPDRAGRPQRCRAVSDIDRVHHLLR